MPLTREDVEQITLSVTTAMRDADRSHKEDHEFIKILKAREEAKQKLYSAVMIHLAKFGALGLITGVATCVWLIFKQKILGT